MNPEWVEWLMGWPIGHTECDVSAMAKFQQWQHSHGKPLENQTPRTEDVNGGAVVLASWLTCPVAASRLSEQDAGEDLSGRIRSYSFANSPSISGVQLLNDIVVIVVNFAHSLALSGTTAPPFHQTEEGWSSTAGRRVEKKRRLD